MTVSTGSPIIADVQGQQYAATIACLVSDGHKIYALTNRHGSAWEVGDGERNVARKTELTQKEAMDIVGDPDFLPSMSVGAIGSILKNRGRARAST